jgi:hypothetical protein
MVVLTIVAPLVPVIEPLVKLTLLDAVVEPTGVATKVATVAPDNVEASAALRTTVPAPLKPAPKVAGTLAPPVPFANR